MGQGMPDRTAGDKTCCTQAPWPSRICKAVLHWRVSPGQREGRDGLPGDRALLGQKLCPSAWRSQPQMHRSLAFVLFSAPLSMRQMMETRVPPSHGGRGTGTFSPSQAGHARPELTSLLPLTRCCQGRSTRPSGRQ